MLPSHLILITKVPLGIWRNTKTWKRSVSTFSEQPQPSTLKGMAFRTPTSSPTLKSIGVKALYVKLAQCLRRTCLLYIISRWLVTPCTVRMLWESSGWTIVWGPVTREMPLPVQYRYNIFLRPLPIVECMDRDSHAYRYGGPAVNQIVEQCCTNGK